MTSNIQKNFGSDTPTLESFSNSGVMQRLFDEARIGLLLIAEDHSIIDASDTWCLMLGYSKQEMLSFNFDQLSNPQGHIKDSHFISYRGKARDLSMPFENRFVCKSGAAFWGRVRVESIPGLGNTVDYKMLMIDDITENKETADSLKRANEHLQKSRESLTQLTNIVEASEDAIFSSDLTGNLQFWSQGAERLYGFSAEEVIDKNIIDVLSPKGRLKKSDIQKSLIAGHKVVDNEARMIHKDGQVIDVTVAIIPIQDSSGGVVGGASIHRDQSELKKLEEQIWHTQKMETAGQLAGGIAHDFNNILTVIQGYCDLIIPALPRESRLIDQVMAIESAGQRASTLTRQLLALSHKQKLNREVIQPKQQLSELLQIIRRTMGDKINLMDDLNSDWNIFEDPAQFEQVILNLLVNSRHAMPDGGRLSIETANVTVAEGEEMTVAKTGFTRFSPEQIKAGDYVLMTISDTGIGMDKQVLERIFEPFYTTKPRGEGTGLGLSVVYGMVTQNGGAIYVETCLGKGTCFQVFFPRERRRVKRSDSIVSVLPSGAGKILLVEDDVDVRNLALSILTSAGYTVTSAGDPIEVLEGNFNDTYDLVLSDIVMPNMNGPEFSRHWLDKHPKDKFLFMSGYADEETLALTSSTGNLLQKPFKPVDLLARVEQSILD